MALVPHSDDPPEAWDVDEVPQTEDLALRIARVDRDAPRDRQLEQIRDAIDEGRLYEPQIEALIAAGWTELEE